MSIQDFLKNIEKPSYLMKNSFKVHCDCIAKNDYQILDIDGQKVKVTNFQQLSDLFPELTEDYKQSMKLKYKL